MPLMAMEVRQHVKEDLAGERARILYELQEEFKISDDELAEFHMRKKAHIKALAKYPYHNNLDEIVHACGSMSDKTLYIVDQAWQKFNKYKINTQFKIVTPNNNNYLGTAGALYQDHLGLNTFKFSSTLEQFTLSGQRGVIEHEIGGHMYNRHGLEDDLLMSLIAYKNPVWISTLAKNPVWCKFLKFQENVADQDPARRSLLTAWDIENMLKTIALQESNNFVSNTHPAARDRYCAVKAYSSSA